MTLIKGSPAGPTETAAAFENTVEADRAALWSAMGGRQGVLRGFTHVGVVGSMALDFTAGAALLGERASDGTASLARGYHVFEDVTVRVQFAPASASARNDAVVVAFADTEDGPLGTGVTEAGPQLVVVTGVSGTTTPRTDTQINTWIGKGGWVRLMDVPIASTDTQINTANIVVTDASAKPPRGSMRKTTNQTIPTGTSFTQVTFNSKEFDRGGMVDLTNNRLVAKETGPHTIAGGFSFASANGGRRIMRLLHNGVEVLREESDTAAFWSGAGSTELDLVAGDLITMEVIQTSGANLDSNAASTPRIYLQARRVE